MDASQTIELRLKTQNKFVHEEGWAPSNGNVFNGKSLGEKQEILNPLCIGTHLYQRLSLSVSIFISTSSISIYTYTIFIHIHIRISPGMSIPIHQSIQNSSEREAGRLGVQYTLTGSHS